MNDELKILPYRSDIRTKWEGGKGVRINVTLNDENGNQLLFVDEKPYDEQETEGVHGAPTCKATYSFLTKTAPDEPILIYSGRFMELE